MNWLLNVRVSNIPVIYVMTHIGKFHLQCILLCPPLKKEGHIALHMSVGRSVGMSVSLNLVQLITQERFAPQASNLVGR